MAKDISTPNPSKSNVILHDDNEIVQHKPTAIDALCTTTLLKKS